MLNLVVVDESSVWWNFEYKRLNEKSKTYSIPIFEVLIL